MNIQLWLDKALSKLASSNPDELIQKMERFGLVEKEEIDFCQPISIEYVFCSSDFPKIGSEHIHELSSFEENELRISSYIIQEETNFDVAPPCAAPFVLADLIYPDYLSDSIFSQAA